MNRTQKWLPFAVVGVVLALYLPFAHAPFQYDDSIGIVHNGLIRDPSNIPAFFASPRVDSRNAFTVMWRPLTMTSFSLNFLVSGPDPFFFRLANIALHALGAALVFFLIETLLSERKEKRFAAFVGALLFAVHPLCTQAIMLVWKRSGLLSALFVLSGVLTFLRASGWKQRIGVAGFMILGLLSKEDAIVFPLLLGSCLLLKPDLRSDRARLKNLAVSVLVAIAYVLLWFFWIRPKGLPGGSPEWTLPVASGGYIVTQIVALWRMLGLIIFPLHLNVDHLIQRDFLSAAEILSALFGLIFLLGIVVLTALKSRSVALGFSFVLIPFLPFLFAPLPIPMDEARAYLPLAGLGILSACALTRGKKAVLAAVAIVAVLLAVRTATRSALWMDGRKLWADSVSQDPRNLRAREGLVFALLDWNQAKEALPIAERTVEMGPSLPNAWLALGRTQDVLGDPKAIDSYRKVVTLDPRSMDGWNNIGAWLADRREWGVAIAAFEKALSLDPSFLPTQRNLELARKLREKEKKPSNGETTSRQGLEQVTAGQAGR